MTDSGTQCVVDVTRGRTILVTGGAGFIGSTLVRQLLGDGYAVRAVDRLLYGVDALAEIAGHPRLEVVQGDVRDAETMRRALAGVDTVAHLAAIVGDQACSLLPELATTTNFEATELLADLCREAGVSRVVFASTCSVYGAGQSDLDEESPVNPVSLYAETKVAAESSLLSRAGTGFAPVVLRFATIYGPAPRPRFDLVANLLMARAVRAGAITIHGGDQWRPFLHVADAAQAVTAALRTPDSAAARIFNVGSNDENYRLRDLGQLIAGLVPGTRLTVDESLHDLRTYHVRFDRFAAATGFRPARTLRDGLIELRDDLQARPELDISDPRWDNARWLATSRSCDSRA